MKHSSFSLFYQAPSLAYCNTLFLISLPSPALRIIFFDLRVQTLVVKLASCTCFYLTLALHFTIVSDALLFIVVYVIYLKLES